MRRVVVTGLGLVSPLGLTPESTWEGLLAGRSGIGEITQFDASGFPVRIAGEVKGFDPTQWLDVREVRRFPRFIQFAVAASDMAVRASGLEVTEENAARVGVVLGSGIGGLQEIEKQHDVLINKGPRRVSPFFIPTAIINMSSGFVSIRIGAKGPNMATVSACSTSAHAIGDALLYIRHGYADAVIAGGSEAVIGPLALSGFASMRALSTRNDEPEKASRPWDKDRDGFVMGEGAAVLLLEELEHARKRGAPILAEVLGFGMGADAYHISAPREDGEGAARVMQTALDDARLRPEQVDYINAHGTGTPLGDNAETIAIKKVFGEHSARVAISSTKSMTGHLLGGAGSLEAAVAVQSIVHGAVPPTINLDEPDPENDLDYVPNTARELPVRVAMTNSFGFGGTNACLIFGALE
ncbi:MAG: beta-ketoacyl-ACP synthase II [Acidobacteria bacterium]|nr:beta-ketoacyl-ACP synthase II [Acidobacteriota bacterium]